MLIVSPLVGTPELQARREAITQRLIDCTRTPDDAILHLSFEVLARHITAAEQEIENLVQARYPAKHSAPKRTLLDKAIKSE